MTKLEELKAAEAAYAAVAAVDAAVDAAYKAELEKTKGNT